MAKAKECPYCGKIFNPKFGGQAWGTEVICTDCFIKKSLQFNNQNTPFKKLL